MVAFKEEFPYLRAESGQLFEFNRDWLYAAITRAADEAGYPSWWLTDHLTESIAFYCACGMTKMWSRSASYRKRCGTSWK